LCPRGLLAGVFVLAGVAVELHEQAVVIQVGLAEHDVVNALPQGFEVGIVQNFASLR